MSLFSALVILVIVGVILWLVHSYIPMGRKAKRILNAVVVMVVILWLLSAFGAFGSRSVMHMGSMQVRW